MTQEYQAERMLLHDICNTWKLTQHELTLIASKDIQTNYQIIFKKPVCTPYLRWIYSLR